VRMRQGVCQAADFLLAIVSPHSATAFASSPESTQNVPLIKIRTTQEIVAARTAQLALLILELMAAARTPAPVFALNVARGAVFHRFGFFKGAGILALAVGH
jgi:hypothetical protein